CGAKLGEGFILREPAAPFEGPANDDQFTGLTALAFRHCCPQAIVGHPALDQEEVAWHRRSDRQKWIDLADENLSPEETNYQQEAPASPSGHLAMITPEKAPHG